MERLMLATGITDKRDRTQQYVHRICIQSFPCVFASELDITFLTYLMYNVCVWLYLSIRALQKHYLLYGYETHV